MVSRLTLYHIQETPDEHLEIRAGESTEEPGKFGSILWGKDGQGRPRMLLSTKPEFDSSEAAKEYMEDILNQCRKAPPAFGGKP